MLYKISVTALFLISSAFPPAPVKDGVSKTHKELSVIAYYDGNAAEAANYPVEKLTHIIFSFLHLKGNKLTVDKPGDSLAILRLVELKQRNPDLKVILSFGGWGGCRTCSDVFSSAPGREEFAGSVMKILTLYKADGLDLDWEYPALPSIEGHSFSDSDKQNFTSLIKSLREHFGKRYELSFAAGGFSEFFLKSIEWNKVMPLVDRVNIMTYDYINGNSTVTGHHTLLYSTPEQVESTDHAVKMLDSLGVPLSKMVIGAAFYARMWENVADRNNGLNQEGKFKSYIGYRDFGKLLRKEDGFQFHYDSVARASFCYNPEKKLFATFDDSISVSEKTIYACEHKLDGIMFWSLPSDAYKDGLLDAISAKKSEYFAKGKK
jgi:chitinase